MLYDLQILRNSTPCVSKEEAIDSLDNFKGHLVGQPCCVLYNDGNTVRALLSIGKKNYTDPTYVVPSKDNHELINNFIDNTIYWQKLNEDIDALMPTQSQVEFSFSDIDSFYEATDKGIIKDNLVSFVTNPDNGEKAIYKGDEKIVTNSIFDLIAPRDYDSLGIKEGDDFIDIIEKLKTSLMEKALVWNTDETFNLFKVSYGEHLDILEDLDNERSLFEVDLSTKYPDAKVQAYYMNEQQIGSAYVSRIVDRMKAMKYNLGSFYVGMTIDDVYKLTGLDINVLIDKILFTDDLRLNYGIITEEQIRSLFNGTATPFDPSADDDDEEHIGGIHKLIERDAIDKIIEELDDPVVESPEEDTNNG